MAPKLAAHHFYLPASQSVRTVKINNRVQPTYFYSYLWIASRGITAFSRPATWAQRSQHHRCSGTYNSTLGTDYAYAHYPQQIRNFISKLLMRNQREYSTLASVNGAAALCIVLTCKTPRIQPNFRYSNIYKPFFNLPGRSKISNLRYCLLSLTSTQGFVGDRPSFFNLMNTEFNESAYLLKRSSWRSTNNCV